MPVKRLHGALSRRGNPRSPAFSSSCIHGALPSPRQFLSFVFCFLLPSSMLGPLSAGRLNLSGPVVASAATCDPTAEQSLSVTASTALNLSSVFDCEGGTFDVSWSGAVNVTESIRIGYGTAVTIVGEGAESSAVRAASAFGPIFVANGSVLYLEDLAVCSGNATDIGGEGLVSGGGVHAVDATVTLVGCVFEDNFALHTGGGVFTNRSRLVVQDTEFRRCNAGLETEAGGSDVAGEGGGIEAESTDVLVEDCLFEDCYAGWRGGGLHVDRASMSLTNSSFSNNAAGSGNVNDEQEIGEGGALSLTGCYAGFESVGPCSVNDSTFYGNTVAREGGAVQLGAGESETYVEMHRCSMRNNTAGAYVLDDPHGDGGAISVGSDTTLLLVETLMEYNYAGNKAGAIILSEGHESLNIPGGNVVLLSCTCGGNRADQGEGGAIYLSHFAAVIVEGDSNNFTNNYSGGGGGVMGATANTTISVFGGYFSGNFGGEYGGAFLSRGDIAISGGLFAGNEGYIRGGVFYVADNSTATLTGGTFRGNVGGTHGGVGYAAAMATVVVEGGNFSGNVAEVGGGAFYIEDSASFSVTGGNFTANLADFGGFLYKDGAGLATCTAASITDHQGVNGGAIYAVGEAEIEWECDVGRSHALSGPAIYARDGSSVTLRGNTLYDNTVTRGSVIIMVASQLRTIEVLFNDSSRSPDVSAVQIDADSTYEAEYTTFTGFVGEAVVFSEGELVLDSVDFSASSAPVLVFMEGSSAKSVVRNTVLGDSNYEALRSAASSALVIPVADGLSNVNVTCSGAGDEQALSPPCSEGSSCVEGDVGVYCQCYVSESTGNETCVSDDTDALALAVLSEPDTTFFPNLLEGELLLSHPGVEADQATSSSGGWEGGVIWNASAISTVTGTPMTWTVFPSSGLILPGESVILGVISDPSDEYEGTTTVTVRADWTGAASSTGVSRRKLATSAAETSMNVTFYHCVAGTFWNTTSNDTDGQGCNSCSDDIQGAVEGLDCSEPGVSTRHLPLSDGYWRASLSAIIVRECLHEDACIGGTVVSSVEDYCGPGYEGPYCAVCSSGYGQGAANECHACTENFRLGMWVVLAVVALMSLMTLAILIAYLIGGQGTVTTMLRQFKKALRSSCCDRREFGTRHGSSSSPPMPKIQPTETPRSKTDIDSGASHSATSRAQTLLAILRNKTGGRGVHWESNKSGNAGGSEQGSPRGEGAGLSGAAAPVVVDVEDTPMTKREGSVQQESREQEANVWGSSCSTDGEMSKPNVNRRAKEISSFPITGLQSGIPLSKLKIVIVVWQILIAFSDVTQVPMPPIYERFLSIIGIFSFDWTWTLSASCIFTGFNFYDQLLIVTIFPLILLCVLGVTFCISVCPSVQAATQRHNTTQGGSNSELPATKGAAAATGGTMEGSVNSSVMGFPRAEAFDTSEAKRSFVVRKSGPQDHGDAKQDHRWRVFARHVTMAIIILYLAYTQVSTVVLQTFACEDLPEVGKRYLRADFSIECDTATHRAYQVYAAVMIALYPLGIPVTFLFFLCRQRRQINPRVENPRDLGKEDVVREKLEKRVDDQSVAPTSFLWGTYVPNRYYYEICECVRRLLLTGILVFILPDTAGRVAISCMFAFFSLLAFELLRPHVDDLDTHLYRTGCLVIFFSNFLALTIKAGILDADSITSTTFAVALVVVNVLLFLSVWWSSWVSAGAMSSEDDIQGEVSGFDVVGEDELKKFLTASSEKSNISDDSGDLKRSSSSTEEGKLVLGSASADSAGPSSPMPKILSHVWHGKSGYWAPAETAEDDGVAGTAKSPA